MRLFAMTLSVALAMQVGCSFIQNRPSQHTACQARWPVLDALGTVGWTVGTIAVSGLRVDSNCASDDPGCFNNQKDKDGTVAVFGLIAATQAVSALYGLHRMSKCHDGFTPPTESQVAESEVSGSCKAAVVSAGVDGFNGRGTSAQTRAWQQRCEQEQAVAEANRQHAVEVERLERKGRELEQESASEPNTTPPPERSTAQPQAVSSKLLVFGGRDHKKFLGCLCSELEADSILNKYGTYGNPYSTDSIWHKYGDYGSRYSDTSVCNAYADHPPIVVTEGGSAIGYLTLNKYKAGAITDPDVLTWLEKKVCEL